MKNGFKINGFTDSHHECDRCGKNGLKGTYNIDTEDGGNFYLGSSCIKKAYQMNQREFTAKVKQDKQERVNKAKAIYDASEEGMFYKSYIGSPEHKRDIEVFGFGKVAEKIKPSYELRKKLELEYNINYLPA